jgi:hypothetical protein
MGSARFLQFIFGAKIDDYVDLETSLKGARSAFCVAGRYTCGIISIDPPIAGHYKWISTHQRRVELVASESGLSKITFAAWRSARTRERMAARPEAR